MAAPFSSSDEAIINTVVPLSQLTLSSTAKAQGVQVETLYDVQRVTALIRRHGFQRVALQFPDELLGDASQVFWAMERELATGSSSEGQSQQSVVELYILADTSYGNCCVDEVAAEHVDADLVVHYGHACLSPTSRIPTIYVFHRLPVDVDACCSSFTKTLQEPESAISPDMKLAMAYDVGYEHASDAVCQTLGREIGRRVQPCRMDKDVNWTRYVSGDPVIANDADRQQEQATPRKTALPDGHSIDNTVVLYLGPESLALTNLLLRLGPTAKVFRYDAETRACRSETGRTNKLLQRRYAAVQKARDAHTVGLLVGTLGLRCYLPLLQHLRRHLTEVQHKRVYTISVGKLNPAKLANFQEIDVFVLVACPENSLVDAATGMHDPRDFFRPIVTPFELLAAFRGRTWTGEYVLDIEQVYDEAARVGHEKHNAESDDSDDEPHFSLVTGGLISRRNRVAGSGEEASVDDATGALLAQAYAQDAGEGVVTVRSAGGTLTRVMDSAGAAHLATRSWRGLEQRLGMDEPAALEVGRTGIAKGYAAGEEGQGEGQRRQHGQT